MKLNQIAAIAVLSLGATLALAQKTQGKDAPSRAAVHQLVSTQELIEEGASEVLRAFTQFGDLKSELDAARAATYSNSLGGWLTLAGVDPSTPFMKKVDLDMARQNLSIPKQTPKWFEPLGVQLQAFKAGDDAAGNDSLLRIFVLAGVVQFDQMARVEPTTRQEMAALLLVNSRQAQFIAGLTEKVSKSLKPNYQNPEDFKADFLKSVLSIPALELKQLFAESRQAAELGSTFDAQFSLMDESQKWSVTSTGGVRFDYTFKPRFNGGHGLTIEKNGKPYFGGSLIAGKPSTIELKEAFN